MRKYVSIHHMLMFINHAFTGSCITYQRFHTSYVNVHLTRSFIIIYTTSVSIHHMLMFIISCIIPYLIGTIVSIHHMLMFIIVLFYTILFYTIRFHTSYVNVHLMRIISLWKSVKCFHTSYVNVHQCLCSCFSLARRRFHTSYVNVHHKDFAGTLGKAGWFPYIIC